MDAAIDDRTLGRIAAVLVALAVLAEQAAVRSFPVRFVLLCILRRAEAVALAFVAEEIDIDWTIFEVEPDAGCGPADAVVLALRLRALAALVFAMMDPDDRDGGWTAVVNPPLRVFCARRRVAAPDGLSFAQPDTS